MLTQTPTTPPPADLTDTIAKPTVKTGPASTRALLIASATGAVLLAGLLVLAGAYFQNTAGTPTDKPSPVHIQDDGPTGPSGDFSACGVPGARCF